MEFYCTSVFPVCIIPPVLHVNLHLHVPLTRTNELSLGIFEKQSSFGDQEIMDRREITLVFSI